MNEERNRNLEGFKSHTARDRAARAQNELIDGISGYDLLCRHEADGPVGDLCQLTQGQQNFINRIEDECWPIEKGREHLLNLLGLGHCRPGFNDYAAEYPVDFETGEVADSPADPTGWVENWAENLCPDAQWWDHHRRCYELGMAEYWSFGTNADYLHFIPARFDWPSDEFPSRLPVFTRVVNGAITHQVVVPFVTVMKGNELTKDFRAESAYALEAPRRSK
jgi:hypothetical protein